MDSSSENRLAIPLSKGKGILILLGAAFFVIASFWLWSVADNQSRYSPELISGAAIVGTLFFGACGIYAAIKLFDTQPGLVLDESGIFDNSSAVSVGQIPWHDISDICELAVANQKFVSIIVIDPKKYIEKCGFVKRQIGALNFRHYGSPINISSNTLQFSHEDLVETVLSFQRRFNAGT